MKAPPILPEVTLHRVLRVARFDGISMAAIAGLFALVSASAHDVTGAIIGVLVAGAGAMELHGASQLHGGSAGGMRWLITSQFCVMVVILGYVTWRLGHPDPLLQAAFRAALKDEQRQVLVQTGVSEAEFVQMGSRMVYFGVGLATLLYQSLMMLYYARRRGAVEQALGGEL